MPNYSKSTGYIIMKDRRKPWQKELRTMPMAKCGCVTRETANDLKRKPKPCLDEEVTAYAKALGITRDEAWQRYYWQLGY